MLVKALIALDEHLYFLDKENSYLTGFFAVHIVPATKNVPEKKKKEKKKTNSTATIEAKRKAGHFMGFF